MNTDLCCIWWLFPGMLLGLGLSWLLGWLLGGKGSSGGHRSDHDLYASKIHTHQTSATETVKTRLEFDAKAAQLEGIKCSGLADIEVIEGIGPVIAGIFREHGLGTLYDIANSTEEKMHELLKRVGGQGVQIANTPATWAMQAHLLVSHRWKDFKTLIDGLDDGKTRPRSSL
jgi:predicted flap endonuclease-1-like 5' DNA nuclease